MSLPLDTLGRRLHDLRISVTDRCNLRCTYCMPAEVFGPDYAFLPKHEMLSYEEIALLARSFAELGVEKLRITGGEPLMRRDIDSLVAMLVKVPGINDIALTTNGLLLPQHAQKLRAAGLTRLTVSLDSLDDAAFGKMNGRGVPVKDVLVGIAAAEAAGFHNIKINAVIQRGVNDSEVLALAKHFRGTGHIMRFIEYMDVGSTNGWRLDEVVPSREIVERISREMPLEPVDPNYHGEVADRWRYTDGSGEEIGVISSVTQAFCGTCTRARLSAKGEVYTCLFAAQGADLRGPLRGLRKAAELGSAGLTAAELDEQVARRMATTIADVWRARSDRYSQIRLEATRNPGAQGAPKVEMSYVGG
jgi:cyclic pyranopterin phosphate synthase